jgi:hypothetical protein
MRPSSTRKSMPSSATVVPKSLAETACFYRCHDFSGSPFVVSCELAAIEQFFWIQSEPLNGCVHPGPMFGKKLLPLAFE